ncbi:Transcriptional regulator prz1 [Zancudomyces culisetae]|uniref:Transcriptional regulator prz1 n=1 Tax=Zancudomyces culisetae TaxID=1213189 RepID=A0A1R1PTE0_ZANCU|nr:Transcriptional regulator prz1 [Zancudomyces culisetae]|eukprot:OMH84221.1 Transcriptional regulator prz1 [Zancudomyces culisetae]
MKEVGQLKLPPISEFIQACVAERSDTCYSDGVTKTPKDIISGNAYIVEGYGRERIGGTHAIDMNTHMMSTTKESESEYRKTMVPANTQRDFTIKERLPMYSVISDRIDINVRRNSSVGSNSSNEEEDTTSYNASNSSFGELLLTSNQSSEHQLEKIHQQGILLNKKTYKCEHCKISFSRLHNLKSHLLTHSNKRPFKCEVCKMTFRRHHDLKRHVKLHTGEKPHICNYCGRGFARLDALNRHIKAELNSIKKNSINAENKSLLFGNSMFRVEGSFEGDNKDINRSFGTEKNLAIDSTGFNNRGYQSYMDVERRPSIAALGNSSPRYSKDHSSVKYTHNNVNEDSKLNESKYMKSTNRLELGKQNEFPFTTLHKYSMDNFPKPSNPHDSAEFSQRYSYDTDNISFRPHRLGAQYSSQYSTQHSPGDFSPRSITTDDIRRNDRGDIAGVYKSYGHTSAKLTARNNGPDSFSNSISPSFSEFLSSSANLTTINNKESLLGLRAVSEENFSLNRQPDVFVDQDVVYLRQKIKRLENVNTVLTKRLGFYQSNK